jgi:hypothetical protein
MSLGKKGRLRMYASITRLELKDEDSIGAAVDALEGLLADARGVAGFRDCYVVRTGPRELTTVTIYDSEAASERASQQLRPTLGTSVGPHVARPPERAAGEVVAGPSP